MLSTLPLIALSVQIYSLDIRESSLSKNAGMVAVNIPTLKYVGYKRSEHHLERRSYWYRRVISRAKDDGVQLELLTEEHGEIFEQELLDAPRT